MRTLKPADKSFVLSTKSLGELNCFPLSMKDQEEIVKRLGKKVNDSTAKEYIRALISVACQRRDVGDEKPPDYSLSLSDIADIQDEEMEAFSQKYLEKNDHLYRKNISRTEPNKDGPGTVFIIESGDVEHRRNEEEPFLDYLYRLTIIDEKRDAERSKELFGFFSNDLNKQMLKTLSMGDALRVKAQDVSFIQPAFHKIDFAEIHKRQEAERRKPFEELAEPLDQLVKLSSNAGEFLVAMNETQTRIASELKSSGDRTALFSKANVVISCLVLLLSVGSLVVAIYTAISSSGSSNELVQNAKIIGSTLQKSSDKTIELSTDNMNVIKELVDQQKKVLAELEAIRTNLETDKPRNGRARTPLHQNDERE